MEKDPVGRRASDFSHVIISVAISLIGGFAYLSWTLADPRAEIKTIHDNYLTLREHTEFRDQVKSKLDVLESHDQSFVSKEVFNRELDARAERWRRQESINRRADAAYVGVETFSAWKKGFESALIRKQQGDDEHRKELLTMIEVLQKRIHDLEQQKK